MAFSMEEVFSALLNLSEDKAPRPDGLCGFLAFQLGLREKQGEGLL